MRKHQKSSGRLQQNLVSATVIVCALMLLLAAIGAINVTQNQPKQMRKSAESGQYSYVNIILLFGPVESGTDTTLYIAADTDQRLHLVRLDEKAFEACSEIYDYSNHRDAFDQMPKSVRIEGVAVLTDAETRQGAISLFNTLSRTQLVTEENFRDYFGETYLDASQTVTSAGCYFLWAAAGLAVVAVVLLVIYFKQRRRQTTDCPRVLPADGTTAPQTSEYPLLKETDQPEQN